MNAMLVVNALSVLLGLVLNLALLPLGGIMAAAGTFSLASWFRVLGLARFHAREAQLPVGEYFRPRAADWRTLQRLLGRAPAAGSAGGA